MSSGLKKRQSDILKALADLGGEATTKEIAERVGLNANGVSQSLGALSGRYVECLGGKAGFTKWKLLQDPKPTEDILSERETERIEKLIPKILNTPLNIGVQADKHRRRVHDDHDGSYAGEIRIFMASDGDMWIKTTEPNTSSGYLRYRGMMGGSMSPRVHNALRILVEAIRLDDLARPIKYPEKSGQSS